MRRRLTRALLGLILAGAWGAGAWVYVERAYACSEMANAVDRPSCCVGGGQTRLTRVGGDCCKDVRWTEATNATVRAPDPAPLAQWTYVPSATLVDLAAIDGAHGTEHVWARAGPERAPPLPTHVETVVLLI